jgi:glycosyltransferase involved in cell wall biosynthesis
MDSPLVTVIITAFNYAHMLGTAIDSALAQDYPNLEVLVVDNASTDATPQLIERYLTDPRFRYIRNPTNIGMVPNHNKGLREARGSYVVFLSADDLLMPHHVSRSFAFLRDHPEIDVPYAAAYFIDESGAFTGVRLISGEPLGAYCGGRDEFAHLFAEGCYMAFPSMLIRRDLFERYGELDEAITVADYEIVIRWAAQGVQFGYMPEQLCATRVHASQQAGYENYVCVGGDVREFAYLIRKFCAKYGDRLDGYERAISRQMWQRYRTALAAGIDDSDDVLRNDLLEVDGLLDEAKARSAGRPFPLHPTVVVLPGARIQDTVGTMRSLVAQTLVDWEAIVLENGSGPFATTAEYLDPAKRLRPFRLTAPVSEAVAINTALRVSSGDWYLIVDAGTILPPSCLEDIAAALRSSEAQLVRTSAAFGRRMPGLESLAFTRRFIDRYGSISEHLGPLAKREFVVRATLSARKQGNRLESRRWVAKSRGSNR